MVGEFGECGRDAPVGSGFDAEFVVRAADVLHERVTAHDHPCCVVAFEPAHRSEPGFEPTVVGFDPIVRVLLSVVKRARDQLLDHRAERRGPIGHNLDRLTMSTQRGLEEPSRRRGVASR
jgi:hypothetical protein